MTIISFIAINLGQYILYQKAVILTGLGGYAVVLFVAVWSVIQLQSLSRLCLAELRQPPCLTHVLKTTWTTQHGLTCVHIDAPLGNSSMIIFQYHALKLNRLRSFPSDAPNHTHADTELHLPLAGPLTTPRGRKVRGSGVSRITTINHTLAG